MIWFGAAFRSALDAPLRIAGPAQIAPHRSFERQLATPLDRCLDWQRQGLAPPAAVTAATARVYAGRILKGAKTTDLPVMQLTKFDNAQTARILASKCRRRCSLADEVIE